MGPTTCCAQAHTRQRWQIWAQGRSELGNLGAGHTFVGEWAENVGGLALNEILTSRDGLHVVVADREHNKTAVLDLLHFQLIESVGDVS